MNPAIRHLNHVMRSAILYGAFKGTDEAEEMLEAMSRREAWLTRRLRADGATDSEIVETIEEATET